MMGFWMSDMMGFITGPTRIALMTVPSLTPTSPRRKTSETMAAMTTIVTSKMSLHFGIGHPVF